MLPLKPLDSLQSHPTDQIRRNTEVYISPRKSNPNLREGEKGAAGQQILDNLMDASMKRKGK